MPSERTQLRRFGTCALGAAAVLAWAIALRPGWSSPEWTGFWSSAAPTRGKAIESEAERKQRSTRQNSELKATLSDLRKDLLGDHRRTRGDDPSARARRAVVPRDVARYTQRDACFQMKLEYPDRFGDVNCMSEDYDDTDPWFRADRKH